jgi:hypothetical protein
MNADIEPSSALARGVAAPKSAAAASAIDAAPSLEFMKSELLEIFGGAPRYAHYTEASPVGSVG